MSSRVAGGSQKGESSLLGGVALGGLLGGDD
jgi:hypothetical protein